MNKWIKLLLGLILIAGAIYVWGMNTLNFGSAALIVLKGGLMWFVIMIALLLIILGITDIKEE